MVQKTYYKTKDYCKVKFTMNVNDANSVNIHGLNSDWQNAVNMNKKKDGSFSCELNLPKDSHHEFKYLVNDHIWINEPEADGENWNIFGGTNSVIKV